MIKPDGVQRGIVGNIISRFETKGYKLVAMKTKQASSEILEQHYKDLVKKPFFPGLKEYMMSGPVVSMVWEGKEAVKTGRKMLGKYLFSDCHMVCRSILQEEAPSLPFLPVLPYR